MPTHLRRYLEKFEGPGDATTYSYSFPLKGYAMEQTQGLYVPRNPLTGANYEYDLMGSGVAVKQNGFERVSFLSYSETGATVDTDIDNLRQKLRLAAKGKLYLIDSSGARRWAYARLQDMPEVSLDIDSIKAAPVALSFSRFSDWYSSSQFSTDYTMNEASESISVNNTGSAKVYNAVFTLIGTFQDPLIHNTTNSYKLQSTRDGSNANHRLRFDAGKNRVEWSTDGGTTYAGDWANFVRAANQVHLMVLEPGSNSFTVTFGAVPNATLRVTFYPAFD